MDVGPEGDRAVAGGGRAAQNSLAAATTILEAGGIWGINPEGSRSRDGRLYRGKTGVMRVALATGAPVVPVVVTGTDRVTPPDTRRWHFGHVHLKICPPLDLSPYAGRPLNQPVVRQATDQLMRVLQSHSQQEHVNVYARRAS